MGRLKRSVLLVAAAVALAALVVVFGIVANRPRESPPAELEPGPDHPEWVRRWAAGILADGETSRIVSGIEIISASGDTVAVRAHLKPASAIGRAAARDPGTSAVETAALGLAGALYAASPDPLRAAEVILLLEGREVGLARWGVAGHQYKAHAYSPPDGQ